MSTPEPPPADDPWPTHVEDEGLPYVPVSPLLPGDPPRVSDFWLDARLTTVPAGPVFTGQGPERRADPMVRAPEGAAADAAARDRLAGVVDALHIDTVLARAGHGQDSGRLARKYRPDDSRPVAPDERL